MTDQRALPFAAPLDAVVTVADGTIAIKIDRGRQTICICPRGHQPIVLRRSTCTALVCALQMADRRFDAPAEGGKTG